MALFNYATKEITLKIVYYGPGLSGKTTNLQYLHSVLSPETKGKLLSLSTEADRTLFFDFLPIELGKIRDFAIRFQLYTVPGQVRYNATRRVVLKGADAIIFVADSQREMREQNIESFENMRENLASNNIDPSAIPVVLQYNKRDLKNVLSVEELNKDLNPQGIHETTESCALDGRGVEDSFRLSTRLLLKDISRKHKIEIQPADQVREEPRPVVHQAQPGRISLKGAEPRSEERLLEPTSFTDVREPEEGEFAFEIDEAGNVDIAETVKEREDRAVSSPLDRADIFRGVVAAPEETPAEAMPASEEALSLVGEKIDLLSNDLAGMTQDLLRISEAVSGLRQEFASLKNDLALLKADTGELAQQKNSTEPLLREIRDFKKEQREAQHAVKEVLELLRKLREKKSWFRLF